VNTQARAKVNCITDQEFRVEYGDGRFFDGFPVTGTDRMLEFAALWAAVLLGSMVSAFSGFAFSAVAGAILLHVYDPLIAIPLMMACSIASQLLTMIRLRRALQFHTGA
jgi:hypothetical protein